MTPAPSPERRARPARQRRSRENSGFTAGPVGLKKTGLAGLVLALHVAGLAVLGWLAPAETTMPVALPIQVSLIQEQTAPPVSAPPEPVVQPPIPKVVPSPPKPQPRPRPQEKPAPRKPVEAAPVTESRTALTSDAPAPEPTPAPAPPAPVSAPPGPPTPAITAARFDADYLNNPPPAYPPLSRRMREEGKVMLRVLVSPAGLPAQVEVSRSSGFERLDRAAENAVRRWRFVPARQGDHAVESWTLVPLIFELKE
ncbi:energy transducer TonB [Thauera sinica]|nr:energy transducer TonB [Thauera sp. K11]